MGSTINKEDQQNKSHDFVQFLTNFKKKSSIKESIVYTSSQESEEAWRQKYIEILLRDCKPNSQTMYLQLEKVIRDIEQDRFVKARTLLHFLNNQELKTMNSKSVFKDSVMLDVKRKSNRVSVDFNRPINASSSILIRASTLDESNLKPKPCKSIFLILIREFTKPYHPVWTVREAFLVVFQDKYTMKLARSSSQNILQAQTQIIEQMHSDLLLYCKVVSGGCSKVYGGWAQSYAGLQGQKYFKVMMEAAMMTLFSQDTLYEILFLLIRSMILKEVGVTLSYIRQDIDVGYFNLRKDLQINGQFSSSLELLNKLDTVKNPKYLLHSLGNLKFSICNDIDSFYRLNDNKYHIDSDDLVGIVCYLMCRCKTKLLSIYCQMKILSIVYGEDMVSQFEQSSYMHTVIEGTFDLLNTKKFRQDMTALSRP